jgi:hypothetical protein
MRPTTIAISACLMIFANSALAHEKGAIHLASKTVSVGGELVLRGEKMPKSATIRLELRGTLETFPLPDVATTATGTFQTSVALPATVRVGTYAVVAIAADGDVVARADLVVTVAAVTDSPVAPTASPDSTAGAPAHDMRTHGATPTSPAARDAPHASAEMMTLETENTGLEWTTMLVLIALSVVGGAALLRSARRIERV